MTAVIHAYAARSAKGELAPFDYEAPPLGPHDVRIAISHCGICYSDVHFIDNDLGNVTYPLVAGHEIVGHVSEVGTSVSHLQVGQRVGVGPYRYSCLHCEYCVQGQENLCAGRQLTIVGYHGGFADAIQVSASYAFPIPERLDSAAAAPLLCAGLTVYAPLRSHTTAATRVGVMSIGGLGHLAVQYARARGCEVTVFSTSADKEVQARELGAHHFVAMSDPGAMAAARGSVDFLLSTGHGDFHWPEILGLLRPNGHLCFVGLSMSPLNVPSAALIMGQIHISGSAAGSRADMVEMLEVAARSGVRPWVEMMPAAEINQAVQRVRTGKARFRVVLDMGMRR